MAEQQCEEKVYQGSQYERLTGRECRNKASVRVILGEQQVWLCLLHVKVYERRFGPLPLTGVAGDASV